MDALYLDIAIQDHPESLKRICVPRTITLKALLDLSSSILDIEIYRLYLNNKKLTDIDQLENFSTVYCAPNISPDISLDSTGSCKQGRADSDTDFTDNANAVKAVVVGENFSGKTSFIMRFIHNVYDEEYSPTSIVAEYCNTIQIEGSDVSVSLLDITDGFIEEYGRSWLLDRQLFIIAIGIEQLSRWKTIMQKYLALVNGLNSVLTFVMITKTDLLNKYKDDEKKKVEMMIKQLEIYADNHNLIVFKSSAKNNKRINSPFIFALKRLQSFKLRNSVNSASFVDMYYKKPRLFRFLDEAIEVCKTKICRP